MLQDITRTIPAGEPSIFNVAGGSLACIAADLPDFAIRFDGDPEALFRVGFEYTPPNGFKQFQVRNTRTAPLTVTFTVAEGQFRDRRQISSAPQTYRPVTIEDAREKGFSIFGSFAGGVGIRAIVGLFNPPGSNRLIVLSEVGLTSDVAINAGLTFFTGTFGTVEDNSFPLYLGDPAGAVQMLLDTVEPAAGDPIPVTPARPLLANVREPFRFDQPFIIPADRGLYAASGVNATLDIDAVFLEIAG